MNRGPSLESSSAPDSATSPQQSKNPTTIPYHDIPHWPRGAVTGHNHQWLAGHIANITVAILSGRTHLYEGFSAREVAFGVRVLGMMGVRSLILTNASGAVNEALQPGSLALIADHINLQGTSPLSGPNEERWGRPFPDLTDAYDAEYRRLARKAAAQLGFDLPEGVYAGGHGTELRNARRDPLPPIDRRRPGGHVPPCRRRSPRATWACACWGFP